jgi:hypothetical protein
MGSRNLGQNRYLFRDLMICGRLQLLTGVDMYGLFVVWNARFLGGGKILLHKKRLPMIDNVPSRCTRKWF